MPRPRSNSSSAPAAFARRFRLLMGYHDLTLRDIAGATHSAVSTVGTWRNGRVPSSPAVLAQLAEIFQVRVEYLLSGEIPDTGNGNVAQSAGQVLADVADLLRALEAEADPKKFVVEEAPPNVPYGSSTSTNHNVGQKPRARGLIRRQQVENYVRSFLDRAEQAPGGLAHAWVQLRREFPLDLHERLRG